MRNVPAQQILVSFWIGLLFSGPLLAASGLFPAPDSRSLESAITLLNDHVSENGSKVGCPDSRPFAVDVSVEDRYQHNELIILTRAFCQSERVNCSRRTSRQSLNQRASRSVSQRRSYGSSSDTRLQDRARRSWKDTDVSRRKDDDHQGRSWGRSRRFGYQENTLKKRYVSSQKARRAGLNELPTLRVNNAK